MQAALVFVFVLSVSSMKLDLEDDKGHIEIELQNGPNTTVQPSWNCESHGGECKNNEQCNGTISIEYTCSKNGVCCIVEGKAKSTSELMVQMIYNSILIQSMAIQTLKENQENQENLLKNLTNTILNLEIAVLNQENMLENIADNQDIIISNLTLIVSNGCSGKPGYFRFRGQCFKMFTDEKRSWADAKSHCESLGLRLAEPTDSTVVDLRKYLLDKHGDRSYTWLGAQGDGSYMRWGSNQQPVDSSSPLWYTGHPTDRVSTSYCLLLLVDGPSYWKPQPERPYWSSTCTNTYYTLCQVALE